MAYGRLDAYIRLFSPAEEGKLQTDAQAFRAQVDGVSYERLLAQAEARKALLEEGLPGYPPDEWVLAGSPAIWDELEDRLQRARRDLPSLPADFSATARKHVMLHTGRVSEVRKDEDMPWYRGGAARSRDYIIHTAIVTGSEFLVTDDQRIATSRASAEPYRDPARGEGTKAVRLNYFVEQHVYESAFDLDDVDGDLLGPASRPRGD